MLKSHPKSWLLLLTSSTMFAHTNATTPTTDQVPRLQQPELALAAREHARLHLKVRGVRVAIPGVKVVAASTLGVDDTLPEAIVLRRVLLHAAAYRESLDATYRAKLVGFK
ncbi:hypothetical protein IF1G_09068 [Cordyceps javanica]|uniref:Uncharacterized protein n=1 Tax=Cordyceps javanica TaxID=43265 RepID=A0A545USX1_9HYPO|nr:hypothetical protein IF1G_09068 [Cordyceps javanica]TQW04217.1 hypothetical protein IF2G_07987 [Cordyceps javanica]